MNFYEIFNTEFAQYKKQNKKEINKIPKKKRTNEAARLFLQQSGEKLRKQLDKSTRNGETANFQGLPNAAKSYFGRDFVAKVKRAQRMEGAELLFLGGPNYAFNDGGAIDIIIKQMKGQQYIGPTFIVFDYEEADDARAISDYILPPKLGPLRVKNKKEIFDQFRKFEDGENYPYWSLWGLFNTADEYSLFISLSTEKANERKEQAAENYEE